MLGGQDVLRKQLYDLALEVVIPPADFDALGKRAGLVVEAALVPVHYELLRVGCVIPVVADSPVESHAAHVRVEHFLEVAEGELGAAGHDIVGKPGRLEAGR